MLSERSYAKFFGENLLEEIFRLDEELTLAIAVQQDPLVEEELEHSLDIAIADADLTPTVLEEAKKDPKFHVYSAFGGTKLSSHTTEDAAHKSASKHSMKQPVHVWTADGGENGMGKPIAHWHQGKKTVYEDFERGLDAMMEAELGETKPKVDWDRARKSADEFLSGKRKGIPGMRMATAKDLGLKKKDIKVNEEAPKKPKRKISDARRNRFHDLGRSLNNFLKGKSYCTNCREHGHSTDDCKATCPDCHGQGRFSRRGCSTCGEYQEPD